MLTWIQDGEERSAVHRVCDTDLLEGEQTSAWVTSGDDVSALYPPWLAHLYAWIVLLFGGAIMAVGALIVLISRAVKRSRADRAR